MTEAITPDRKMLIKFKMVTRHSRDCYAIKNARAGTWSNPWSYLAEPVEYRDAIGRKRKSGSYRWLHVRCNCTHCPGRAIIRENDILELLPHE